MIQESREHPSNQVGARNRLLTYSPGNGRDPRQPVNRMLQQSLAQRGQAGANLDYVINSIQEIEERQNQQNNTNAR